MRTWPCRVSGMKPGVHRLAESMVTTLRCEIWTAFGRPVVPDDEGR